MCVELLGSFCFVFILFERKLVLFISGTTLQVISNNPSLVRSSLLEFWVSDITHLKLKVLICAVLGVAWKPAIHISTECHRKGRSENKREVDASMKCFAAKLGLVRSQLKLPENLSQYSDIPLRGRRKKNLDSLIAKKKPFTSETFC